MEAASASVSRNTPAWSSSPTAPTIPSAASSASSPATPAPASCATSTPATRAPSLSPPPPRAPSRRNRERAIEACGVLAHGNSADYPRFVPPVAELEKLALDLPENQRAVLVAHLLRSLQIGRASCR